MDKIQITRWDIDGDLPEPMMWSDATGARLLKAGAFGADLIRFPPGGKVGMHTHPGDHILIVISGTGWVDYGSDVHRLDGGCCYLIPGATPHGIRAESALTLISVANDHRDVAAATRLVRC